VLRIDVFAAQLRQLIVRKKIPETEHSSARATARLEQTSRNAALLQPIRANQPRGARPDDDDVGRLRPARSRSENRRHARAGGGGYCRLEKTAPVPASRLDSLHRFVRAGSAPLHPGSDPQRALDVLK